MMLRKFQALDPIQEIGEAIQRTAPEAIALNREQLFEKGEKATGEKLKPYSPGYARRKLKMRGRSIVDGYLTGEMQREIFVDVRENGTAVFDSASPHAAFMIKRDGPAIFGLSADSKAEYSAVIHPVYMGSIKRKTGVQ